MDLTISSSLRNRCEDDLVGMFFPVYNVDRISDLLPKDFREVMEFLSLNGKGSGLDEGRRCVEIIHQRKIVKTMQRDQESTGLGELR